MPRDPFSKNPTRSSSGVTRKKLGNLLKSFKIDILGTLSMKLDAFKDKQRHGEENEALSILFSNFCEKHPLKDCALNKISMCGICVDNHQTY